MQNKMSLSFISISQNEAFARNVIASFMLSLNPTLSEISDVKTAVSEAVTNAIVHGYKSEMGIVELSAVIDGQSIHIEIKDGGVGIENVDLAKEPFFTTGIEGERSGMGFTVMRTFMDSVDVISKVNEGTTVIMSKKISNGADKE
ncbi:MAG: anti-sigma F factor [Clostridia bacterium]|nr:anti-sigma F factor [Clostridia bacterium]